MAASAGSFSNLVDADFILGKRVIGGLPQVPERLAERLGAERVLLGHPVRSLRYDEGGVEVPATYAAPFWRADGLSGTAFSPYSLVHEAYDNSTHGEQHGTLVGFVSDEKADRVLALDEGERKAAILDSLAAYFGPAALDPLVYYESDWASEEWTQGAYAASFDLGGLTRYGALQLEPVGPLRLGTSDIAAEGYQHVDGAIRVGRRLAQEIIDEDAATARASHREGAQHA